MVRPFSGHRHRRGKASPQGVPGRPTGPRKDTVGRSECGSDHTETPCGASLPSGRSVLESDRPGTGVDLLTVGVVEPRAEAVAAIETAARECDTRGEADRAAL